MEIIGELWMFLKIRKKYWLIPIVVIALLMAGLILVSQGSVLGPFIYALF